MGERLLFINSLLLLLFLFFTVSALGYHVKSVYIFGDSIFDAGNNHYNKFCDAQADFPPYGSTFFHRPTGRFTNGRTVADFLSQYIGLVLQKPFLEAQLEFMNGTQKNYPSNGINFASAGSGILPTTNKDMNVTSLEVQLQQFQSLIDQNHIGNERVKQSLFFFESGSNDIFNYFQPFEAQNLSPNEYVKEMLRRVQVFVDKIYSFGARRIALFSLGPVGCVPARALLPGAPTNKCYGNMNNMVKNFNVGLENIVKAIHIKHPSAIAVYGAVYDTVQRLRTNASHYGFNDVSSACCGYGTLGGQLQCGREGYKICSSPDKFLFWDYFHPSETTYEFISKALWAGGRTSIRPINLKALANII